MSYLCSYKADDGARTRNLFLGKETFYQLNYIRERSNIRPVEYEGNLSVTTFANLQLTHGLEESLDLNF